MKKLFIFFGFLLSSQYCQAAGLDSVVEWAKVKSDQDIFTQNHSSCKVTKLYPLISENGFSKLTFTESDKKNFAQLIDLIYGENPNFLKYFLSKLKNKSILNAYGDFEAKILMEKFGCFETERYPFECIKPIHYAFMHGNLEIIELLRLAGAQCSFDNAKFHAEGIFDKKKRIQVLAYLEKRKPLSLNRESKSLNTEKLNVEKKDKKQKFFIMNENGYLVDTDGFVVPKARPAKRLKKN